MLRRGIDNLTCLPVFQLSTWQFAETRTIFLNAAMDFENIIIGEQAAPNWLRKLLIVLISGRHTLVQFSDALSLRDMAGQYGAATDTAHKLLRMARFHFYRQQR